MDSKVLIGAAIALMACSLLVGAPPARAQGWYPIGGNVPHSPTSGPSPFTLPAAVHTFTPSFTAPSFLAPTITLPANTPPVFPKDITNIILPQQVEYGGTLLAIGVKELNPDEFSEFNETLTEGILVVPGTATDYYKVADGVYKLNSGTLLLSLRGPARFVTIQTNNGSVQLKCEGDAFATYEGGILRIANATARGIACKVLTKTSETPKLLAVAPGYELVVGRGKLMPNEIRVADGVARRRYHVFEGQQLAVNEISIRSVLLAHPIVMSMLVQTTPEERRSIDDMCKMAEVLDYVHGAGGYKIMPATGIATAPHAETK
jgi:hypothetical protein